MKSLINGYKELVLIVAIASRIHMTKEGILWDKSLIKHQAEWCWNPLSASSPAPISWWWGATRALVSLMAVLLIEGPTVHLIIMLERHSIRCRSIAGDARAVREVRRGRRDEIWNWGFIVCMFDVDGLVWLTLGRGIWDIGLVLIFYI